MRGIPVNGDAIRCLRKHRAWSQEVLAIAAGCSTRTISNAERGKRLDADTLHQIAMTLEADLATVTAAGHHDATAERNLERVREWHDAYVAQDVGALLAMHHAETVLELPGTETMPAGGNFYNLDGHRTHYEAINQVFPVTKVHQMPIRAVGDRVFAYPLATLHAIETGEKFTQPHVNEFRICDGKIIYRTSYQDLSWHRRNVTPREAL